MRRVPSDSTEKHWETRPVCFAGDLASTVTREALQCHVNVLAFLDMQEIVAIYVNIYINIYTLCRPHGKWSSPHA